MYRSVAYQGVAVVDWGRSERYAVSAHLLTAPPWNSGTDTHFVLWAGRLVGTKEWLDGLRLDDGAFLRLWLIDIPWDDEAPSGSVGPIFKRKAEVSTTVLATARDCRCHDVSNTGSLSYRVDHLGVEIRSYDFGPNPPMSAATVKVVRIGNWIDDHGELAIGWVEGHGEAPFGLAGLPDSPGRPSPPEAGVREPRRPLPTAPSMAAGLDENDR